MDPALGDSSGLIRPVTTSGSDIRSISSSSPTTGSISRLSAIVAPLTTIDLDHGRLTALDSVAVLLAVVALDTTPVFRLGTVDSLMLHRVAVAAAENLGLRALARDMAKLLAVVALTTATASASL
jgi:hypothetical protein